MGLDYIRSATGKPWRKRWARELDKMKTPTLLDLEFGRESSTVRASFKPGVHPRPGDAFVAQIIDNHLVVFDGLRAVGLVIDPPAKILEVVAARCGHAEVLVERVGFFGGNAELSLR